jgi:glutamate/tyrosine decarboxylase-like PLP-dependent enzyme
MRTADAVHAADEYVGVLLAGSTLPALAALLMGRRVVRRWRDGRSAPSPSPIPGS